MYVAKQNQEGILDMFWIVDADDVICSLYSREILEEYAWKIVEDEGLQMPRPA
jgi:hypothetical protein